VMIPIIVATTQGRRLHALGNQPQILRPKASESLLQRLVERPDCVAGLKGFELTNVTRPGVAKALHEIKHDGFRVIARKVGTESLVTMTACRVSTASPSMMQECERSCDSGSTAVRA
jgi:hypothetical protein